MVTQVAWDGQPATEEQGARWMNSIWELWTHTDTSGNLMTDETLSGTGMHVSESEQSVEEVQVACWIVFGRHAQYEDVMEQLVEELMLMHWRFGVQSD